MSPSETPRSSEARERILTAAAAVFARSGFDAAGVDEIARQAGVNKAMLYYHVGDKQALFSAVVRAYICQIKAELDPEMVRITDPRARLAAVPRAFARVMAARPDFPRLMLRELAGGGEHLPDDALVEMGNVIGLTRSILAAGRQAGVFREVQPLLTHLLLIQSVLFMANAEPLRIRLKRAGVIPGDLQADPRVMADFVTDILLHGITTPSGRAQ